MPSPRPRTRLSGPGVALLSLTACGPAQPPADIASTTTNPTPIAGTSTTASPSTSTGTSTTDAPTSTSSGTTDNTLFIIKPDGGGDDGQFLCDTFAQDCPEGEKCTLWVDGEGGLWNASKCVEVTGTRRPGESCTTTEYGLSGIDDCEAGAMCWDVDETGKGTCRAHCMDSEGAPICPPGFVCNQSRILGFCYELCDPLQQNCMQPADLCFPGQFDGTSYCVRDDSPIEGVTNDPCKRFDDCEPGFYCLETPQASKACSQDFEGCCQPFCEHPGGVCPNPDQTCKQFYDPNVDLPPGAEKLGVCTIHP